MDGEGSQEYGEGKIKQKARKSSRPLGFMNHQR